MGDGVPDTIECRFGLDIIHIVPDFLRHFPDRTESERAGCIYQNIDFAIGVNGSLN
jgi:hypothetical protein